jgi:hypothetical protein
MIRAGAERRRRDLTVIPVRVDDCEIPAVPVGESGEMLIDLHCIDLFPDFERGVAQVAAALRA